jgi:hypothetical protein
MASIWSVVPARPSNYLLTFWALSYQRGYRARALPATILQWVGIEPVPARLVAWISTLLLVAALVLLVHLGASAVRARPGVPALLVAVLLVASPVTLRPLAAAPASLDLVGVVLALAALVVLLRTAGPAGLVVVGALATAGVLVHEAFVVLALPAIVAAVVVRLGIGRRLAAGTALVLVGPLLALAWTATDAPLPRSELLPRLAEVHQVVEVDPGDRRVAWPILNHTRSLHDELRHTARRVEARGHEPHLRGLLACLPTLAVAGAVGAGWVGRERRLLLGVLWAGVVLAPLLLAPVGHDWGRWMTSATLNGVVAVAWYGAWSSRRPAPVPRPRRPGQAVLVGVTVLALLAPVPARNGQPHERPGRPTELLQLLTWAGGTTAGSPTPPAAAAVPGADGGRRADTPSATTVEASGAHTNAPRSSAGESAMVKAPHPPARPPPPLSAP